MTSIILYEMGFSDRVISQELVVLLNLTENKKDNLLKELKEKSKEAKYIINNYPSYFQKEMLRILGDP